MTFFAGTYVRHPLAIRAALSALTWMKHEGPSLQEDIAVRTKRFADELNAWCERESVPMRVTYFRSMVYFVFQQEFKYSSLLFFHLRLKGLHIFRGAALLLFHRAHRRGSRLHPRSFPGEPGGIARGRFRAQARDRRDQGCGHTGARKHL